MMKDAGAIDDFTERCRNDNFRTHLSFAYVIEKSQHYQVAVQAQTLVPAALIRCFVVLQTVRHEDVIENMADQRFVAVWLCFLVWMTKICEAICGGSFRRLDQQLFQGRITGIFG
jgi:hypothetical protein